MYIIKNAFRNIFRQKGRNILIAIIICVIALSSCVALSISESAKKAEQAGKESLSITAQISVDRQKLMESFKESGADMRESMQKYQNLSLEELEKYKESQYVKDFLYYNSASLNGTDTFTPIDTTGSATQSATSASGSSNSSSNTQSNAQTPPDGMGGGKGGMMGTQGDFTVTGYSDLNAMTDFVNGTCKVSSGAMFDETADTMQCVISDELATQNSLKVGSTIKLVNPNKETESFTFTVSGIYTNSQSGAASEGMRFNTASDPANQIYVSYASLNKIAAASEKSATSTTNETTGMTTSDAIKTQTTGYYTFASLSDYENFAEDVYTLGLDSNYTVSSSDITQFEQSLVPLQNLSKYANIFLLVILVIGAIILIVLNIFNIRERKYEVGVLTAIGMKKRNVALQFICELFAITIIAMSVSTIAGAFISVPVGNAMLSAQITASESANEQTMENFGRPGENGTSGNKSGNIGQGGPENFGTQAVDYVNQINSSIDLMVLGKLFLIGIALTVVASSVAVIFILRYEPLKILADR